MDNETKRDILFFIMAAIIIAFTANTLIRHNPEDIPKGYLVIISAFTAYYFGRKPAKRAFDKVKEKINNRNK